MGKKRQPLRQAAAAAKSTKEESSSNKNDKRVMLASKAKLNNKGTAGDKDSDEDDEWARIEREANKTTKRTRTDSNDDDDDDSNEDEEARGDSSDEDSDSSEDNLNLDGKGEEDNEQFTFEFNDMKEEYSAGIRSLLAQTVIQNPTEAYALADAIVEQEIVGTVVCCEEASDVFAYASLLPIAEVKETNPLFSVLRSLKSCINDTPQKPHNSELMLRALSADSSPTGILLHQRFSNFPIPLIYALHKNLLEDVRWAMKGGDKNSSGSSTGRSSSSSSGSGGGGGSATTSELQPFIDMKNVLLVCACNVDDKSKGSYDFASGKCYDALGNSSILCEQFEDDVYIQHSSCAVLFRCSKTPVDSLVVAALIPMSSFAKCSTAIENM